jgi:pilus assembly protein CpaB
MRRRLLAIFLFASAVGGLAAYLVYQAVSQVTRQPTEEIVVAAVNLDLGETLSTRHVKVVPWPRASMPSGALTSAAETEGRVVRTSIVAGEPLVEAKLAPRLYGEGGIMPMLIPEGYRGVTIKVDDAIRESGFIHPNSRVDVLFSHGFAGSTDRKAKVVLQDVPVLAAGKAVELRDNKPVSVTTVTLGLTPQQAEHLALAQVAGKLTLATRNIRDRQIVETRGANLANLIDGAPPAAAPAPAKDGVRPARPPAPSASRPAAEVTHTITVFRAEKASTQQFRHSGDGWVEQPSAR